MPLKNHRKELHSTSSYKQYQKRKDKQASTAKPSDVQVEQSPTHTVEVPSADVFDFIRMSRIVEFIRQELEREERGEEQPAIQEIKEQTIQEHKEEYSPVTKLQIRDVQTAAQNRDYLYFLKTVCQQSKKEALKFIKNNLKRLIIASIRNTAGVPDKTDYQIIKNSNKLIKKQNNKEITIKRIKSMNKIKSKSGNNLELEYLIYKYGCDYRKIAQASGLTSQDAILEYYLAIPKIERPNKELLRIIADRDWPEGDRILFEENFKRHGHKYWKYQMPKNEEEIATYALYYGLNNIPEGWNREERGAFARTYSEINKNWPEYETILPEKTARQIKKYYREYFSKLTESEQSEEMHLGK